MIRIRTKMIVKVQSGHKIVRIRNTGTVLVSTIQKDYGASWRKSKMESLGHCFEIIAHFYL
jgi:hypothetical protein